ncbi:ABC transporter substrate-binding protein [Thiohalobacter sp. IOR34]|uniref:ABC transporter substrate-binding protein n=1 Tax=Thiohalobacter sp. IOR34 TaxID=3057176 RepID=UPI0025B0D8DC|nr:ABC transporter substrate-binding protein [Thiohalobacter sp. IOR34]WJW76750.1 ABC transporter substrate-binding protein [Thiohalobacter sp. IOR34]
MRAGWGWFLLCGLLLFTAGCQRAPDDVIRFGLAAAADNLDPRFATDATSARVNRLLYAALVGFDEHMNPVPALAEWQRLTPTRYRFSLRPGRRPFHDGQRLTAADVKASYDFVLDPANASPHRTALALIDHIEVIDDDHLEFHLKRPDPLFPGYLVIGILPARLIAEGHDFQTAPLGSGPFRFLDRPEPGRLRLQRLDDGQRFELLAVKNATVRVLKLRRGELDLLQNDLEAELIAYLEAQPDIEVVRGQGSKFAYLGFNLEDPALGQLAVRRAIGHAIDRQAIIHYVLADAARPAGALLPPSHWAGNPALHGLDYDPERARALLHEAGYGAGHPLRLVYKTSTDPLRIRIATILQDQLARVGIEVALKTYDWGTFYGDIKAGRFQMYSLAWVGIKTPDIFRYVFHSDSLPPAGANRGRFRDPVTDRLIEQAEASTDRAEQARLYRALQARLAELLPYVPLWYEDNVYAARRGIRGYRLAPDGNYDGLRLVQRVRGDRE